MHSQAEQLSVQSEHFIYVDNRQRSAWKRLLWERRHLAKVVRAHHIERIFTPYQIHTHIDSVSNVIMLRNMEPFTFHKYQYSLKNKIRNKLLKSMTNRCVKQAEKVIAVSEHVRSHLAASPAEAQKVTRIYHGRDESFSPVATSDDARILTNLGIHYPYVFTCGSLLPYRNCEKVIQAYGQIYQHHLHTRGVRLVVAGKADDRSYAAMLQDLICKLDLQDKVIMLGQVNKTSMQTLYRQTSLFVTASETEACPNIAIEAMASGCKIISSEVPPMPEIFSSAAVYYQPEDIASLACLIRDNISYSVPTQASEALHRAKDFSWLQCADQTFRLLSEAID